MEMVIDGDMEMVIGDDIHDDRHVIAIVICVIYNCHVIYNCPGYDNRGKIDHRDLSLPYRHPVLDYELFSLLNNQFEFDDHEHQVQQHLFWRQQHLQYLQK